MRSTMYTCDAQFNMELDIMAICHSLITSFFFWFFLAVVHRQIPLIWNKQYTSKQIQLDHHYLDDPFFFRESPS